jgi:hypothetical protein
MGLCGLGLLSDNLGKILGWTRGASPWRSSHPQKPDLAPWPWVPRPRSAERPVLQQLPRSVWDPVGGRKEEGGMGSFVSSFLPHVSLAMCGVTQVSNGSGVG